MQRSVRGKLRLLLIGATGLAVLLPNMRAQQESAQKVDPYTWNNRPPDPRFKADILVVVAHPDDEVMAGAYLAREIFDHHMRVRSSSKIRAMAA